MTNEFCTYEQALALKELKFDEPCFGYYFGKDKEVYLLDGQMSAPFEPSLDSKVMFRAPLKQQAFRWFREKYEVFIYINLYRTAMNGTPLEFEYYYRFPKKLKSETIRKFNTYEEAESACIDKLIEIVKNK